MDLAAPLRRTWRRAWALASHLTLVQRFAVISLAILIAGGFIIGRYVAGEIEDGVTARSSAITALYVDSFVSPHLQDMGSGQLDSDQRSELDRLLVDSSFGQEIASFKVWDTQGSIVYARDTSLIGQQFGPHGGLSAALAGNVQASVTDLREEENRLERQQWDRLLETYAPVREHETGAIIGAMEFYQDPSDLESEIASSQRTGWLIVGISTAGMYLLLVGLVKGASNTLSSQHRSLARLAEDNARLAEGVQKAAAEKTETDERLLMQISHDLHDGPTQDLGLALLRIRSLREGTEVHLANSGSDERQVREDFELVETALADALKEVREISSDLHLPKLAELSLRDVVEKAKLDHERKTGTTIELVGAVVPDTRSLPLKIVVYRVLQEALNNSYRHAGGREQRIGISHAGGWLQIEAADGGPGFRPAEVQESSDARRGLGLRGMRERVEMLGGTLEIASGPTRATTIRVRLPLEAERDD
jgi:signal transduction histidine kinase